MCQVDLFVSAGGPDCVRDGAQRQSFACRDDVNVCVSNVKNIATALEMYAMDHDGHYPTSLDGIASGSQQYLRAIPQCPAAKRDTYSVSYKSSSEPVNSYTVYCSGHNHEVSGLVENYPQYTSEGGLRYSSSARR